MLGPNELASRTEDDESGRYYSESHVVQCMNTINTILERVPVKIGEILAECEQTRANVAGCGRRTVDVKMSVSPINHRPPRSAGVGEDCVVPHQTRMNHDIARTLLLHPNLALH